MLKQLTLMVLLALLTACASAAPENRPTGTPENRSTPTPGYQYHSCPAGTDRLVLAGCDDSYQWWRNGTNTLCAEWKPLPRPTNFAVACAGRASQEIVRRLCSRVQSRKS